jgi:hypothetical protein
MNPREINGQPQISVNLEGYHCACWLDSTMPLYRRFFDEIGDRKPMSPAVYIKAISGKDTDYYTFHRP